ncbi:hypothetical protein ACGFR8_11550 [Streptomyces brevispora]|uniref:hypothetical protein n=1 Tax=Streptomyces brevispora TaxID=887462 RepID=UPI003712E105
MISQGAHFLGLTKKDLVAEAVRVYLDTLWHGLPYGRPLGRRCPVRAAWPMMIAE